MKELPILFKPEMIKAILAGRKTQTRRIVKPQPIIDEESGYAYEGKHRSMYDIHNWKDQFVYDYCRYAPNDVMWVKETFCNFHDGIIYKIDGKHNSIVDNYTYKWKSPLFMPRSAARLFLVVTDVRIEKLNDITAEDCIAEGILDSGWIYLRDSHIKWEYTKLWESINGDGSWNANPWVFVISFSVIKPF
jgi:hypothetical protein